MESKFAGYSKAFQWTIVAILLLAKMLFDIEITEADLEPIITTWVAFASAAWGLYWTVKRKQPIHFWKPDTTEPVTFWTVEDYSDMDFVMWADADISVLPVPAKFNPDIQYDQTEYKAGSYYCTAYACFTCYSFYTWKVFTLRKKFIDVCLDEWLIVEWVGWYLHKVFDRFIKFCREELWENYNWFRVEMGSDIAREVRALGYAVATWYRGGSKFNSDRQDDCIVQKPTETTTVYGHALGDFLKHDNMRQDNYYWKRTCNVYKVMDYDNWVRDRKYHFRFWYFLTQVADEVTESYAKTRNEIILKWLEKIRNGEKLDVRERIALRNWWYGDLLI